MSAISRKARVTKPLTPARARLLRSTSIAAAAAFLALATGVGPGQAENLNWDLNADPAIQNGGSGNWNSTDQNWSLDAGAGAGASDQDFDNGDDVTFGPASGGTVTINDGDVRPNSITFSGNGYTIARSGGFNLDVDTSMTISANAGISATLDTPIGMGGGESIVFNNGTTGTITLADDARIVGGGTVELRGGTLNIQGDDGTNDIDADFTNTAGITNNAGNINGTVTVAAGDFNNLGAGDISGLVTVNGTGAFNNVGDIDDSVNVSQTGSLINSGDITGGVTLTDSATLSNNTGGTIVGTTVINGAGVIVTADGGDFDGGVTLSAGTLNYEGNSDGNVTATGGAINVNAGGTLDGTLNNAGATTIIAATGRVTGATTVNGGSVDNDGTIDDNVSVSAGTLTNTGSITGTVGISGTGIVDNNATGDIDGVVTVNGGGTLNANGGLFNTGPAGIVNNGATSTVNINANTTVNITNANGDLSLDPGIVLTGNINNNGGDAVLNGTVTGTIGISGGEVTTVAATVVGGNVTLTGGTLTANGGTFNGAAGIINNGGTVSIAADTDSNLTHSSGTTTITGVLTGDVTQTGSDATGITNNGGIIGDVDVQGSTMTNNSSVSGTLTTSGGTFNNAAGGSVVGATMIDGGTVNATGGSFGGVVTLTDGNLVVTGGTFNTTAPFGIVNGTANGDNGQVAINADTTVDIQNRAGDLDIATGVTLTGDVNNNGGDAVNNGVVTGDVTVSGGSFENDDTNGADALVAGVGGTLTISGGSFDNESGANVAGAVGLTGGTLNMNGGTFGTPAVTNNGGAINVNADTAANVTNTTGTLSIAATRTLTGNVTSDGTVTLNGVVGGNLTNTGIVNAAGGSQVTGTVNNNMGGTITVAGPGIATFDNGITNGNGAILTISPGGRLDSGVGQISNLSGGTFNTSGIADAIVNNSGTINATGATFNRVVQNNAAGIINGTGNLTFNGALNSSGTIDLANGSDADRLFLNASSNLNGTTLAFDVNLNPVPPPVDNTVATGDRLVMAAGTVLSGNITLAFNNLGAGGVDIDDLIIIDADGALGDAYTVVGATGLPSAGGKFTYSLATIDGDTVLLNELNPGITSLAGNVTLTQSLIGSIINRPSSPFVSGLAYDDPDPCGVGVWGRAIAGTADATGESRSDIGATSNSELSATFGGVQLGSDFACFNGFVRGWDLAVGGIGGVNLGSVDQPVRVAGLLPGSPLETTSNTKADFLQYYGGVYATASRGPLALDLQYRLEQTDFTVTNTAVGNGVSLGITDSEFSSKAQTLSGSASYGIPIGDSNFAIVPTVGFAWTRTKTDPIVFDNGDTLKIADFDSQTAFVGATVARTVFSESGDSLQRQFITASYYNDFADDPTAVFNFDDGMGNPAAVENLVNENLGAYTELSAGWNYVRILNPGQIGPARQLDASIRADARIGDQLNSYGITGQLRLQF